MKISVLKPDGDIIVVNVEPRNTIEELKSKINSEINIPINEQTLKFNGQIIENSKTLSNYSIVDDSLIELTRGLSFDPKNPLAGVNINLISAEGLQEHIRGHQQLYEFIKQTQPRLAQAVDHPSPLLLETFLAPIQKRSPLTQDPESRLKHLERIASSNPMDTEAQKALEEEIQRRNIAENRAHAYEYHPESFVAVLMLYIECKVNDVPLKAFVDSGAQMTIMNKKCAEKCGLMKLLDKDYGGLVRGVGSGRLLGRIHLAQMVIGKSFFNISISVLDQDEGPDMLLGLDMLRQWQCSIDLKENCLRIGEEKARFLSEHELPRDYLRENPSPLPQTPTVVNPFERNHSVPSTSSVQGDTTSSSTRVQVSENDIKTLLDMGVSRKMAEEALEATKGNVGLAIQLLFGTD